MPIDPNHPDFKGKNNEKRELEISPVPVVPKKPPIWWYLWPGNWF